MRRYLLQLLRRRNDGKVDEMGGGKVKNLLLKLGERDQTATQLVTFDREQRAKERLLHCDHEDANDFYNLSAHLEQ